MALFYAYKSRGLTRDIRITGGPDGYITPQSGDVLRAIIQQNGVTFLTITSASATANGSVFTISGGAGGGSNNRLRIDAQDLTFAAGIYTLVVDYFDHQDADEWKHVDSQIFVLEA